MSARVGQAHWGRKAKKRGDSYEDSGLIQSLSDACRGYVAKIAAEGTVYKWMEGVNPSPVRQFCRLLEACLDLNEDREAALAPLHWVNQQYLVPRQDADTAEARRGITRGASQAMQEVGEAISYALEATEDGYVTPQEWIIFQREHDEALERLALLRKQVDVRRRKVS